MSDYASKELAEELYKISGWANDIPYSEWQLHDNGSDGRGPVRLPGFSAGYLLRKLPSRISLTKGEYYGATWSNEYGTLHHSFTGKTPEDALVKLCLKLIEEGILPISRGGNEL